MYILGLETSCDETAAAIIDGEKRAVLSNIIHNQLDDHIVYGGVVPEIAARAHLQYIHSVVEKALSDAGLQINDIDGFAATSGPGLIGGVMVGMMMAKGLAQAQKKPFIPVNHLEGHALTVGLSHNIDPPYLLLLISGGHTQFILAKDVGDYVILGQSIDDALGEAFDKTAKMLGLSYPGGPALENLAKDYNPEKDIYNIALPQPLKGRASCDFSFSGLKTAVLKVIENHPEEKDNPEFRSALAHHFHATVCSVVTDRLLHAHEMSKEIVPDIKNLVVAGGVAANQYLRNALESYVQTNGLSLCAPPIHLCTDNAAMIAWAGYQNLKSRSTELDTNTLRTKAQPRWSLETLGRNA